jgi:uncharacterized alpha-E superfamily protein
MLTRVADAIFWTNRYVERAVAASRLVDVTLHLQLDAGSMHESWELWDPKSVISCIHKARESARAIRDSLPSEMWEQLNTLHLWLHEPGASRSAEENPAVFYRGVREGAQFFQGLADATMMHTEDWHFTKLGMYLERADNVARALNLLGHLLETDPAEEANDDPMVRWLAVLRSCGSAEAYARYYSLRVEPARVVEFLLLNPIFPQSVRFSLNAAHQALRGIAAEQVPSVSGANPAIRALGRLQARLEYAAVDELLERGLRRFLDDLQGRIADASDRVTALYLTDIGVRTETGAVERAAMMMALQQQQ